jgi:predicted short-subunit dehydrogenase-like oxidoreductase (DUF2520 family)
VFAKRFQQNGHFILQVWGRDILKAEILAQLVNAKAVAGLKDITKNADVYIIAISDKAVQGLIDQLSLPGALVLHTTASLSKHVLKDVSNRYGVLYPLQSLRKLMDEQTPIPFLIDGNTETVIKEIQKLAASISDTVVVADDETRVKLHVAAVFACNFTNYMYLQSASFCEKENLDFSLLQPLIEETATRLKGHHPSEVFTGPAVRGDVATLEKHLSLLESYPELEELYKELSNKIMKQYGKQ